VGTRVARAGALALVVFGVLVTLMPSALPTTVG
jgi:hypothetical protein